MPSKIAFYRVKFPTALVLVLGLAACAGQRGLEDDAGRDGTAPPPTTDQDDDGITTGSLDQRGLLGISEDDRAMFVDPDNPLSIRTVYFEFDSSRIQPKFNQAIQAHADYLANHPEVRLRLEGHTDERGTREYNVALGERRAESVQKALVLSGAGPNQITTLSFGEEQPAQMGSSDSAYAKNRRVELIYVEQ